MSRGRIKPYTAIGIRRVPCARCGEPSSQQWQVCANGNRWLGICWPCDVAINRLALEFMRIPNAEALIAAYAEGAGAATPAKPPAEPDDGAANTDRLSEVTRQLIAVRLNRPSHSDLCRLSLMFGRSSDLRTDQDIRINEWLKAQIADAKGEL